MTVDQFYVIKATGDGLHNLFPQVVWIALTLYYRTEADFARVMWERKGFVAGCKLQVRRQHRQLLLGVRINEKPDVSESNVIVTFIDREETEHVDLQSRGITKDDARALRNRLRAFEDDWNAEGMEGRRFKVFQSTRPARGATVLP